MTFADNSDKALFIFGTIFAIICGFGMPSQVLLFSDNVDAFVKDDKDKIKESIINTVKLLCYLGFFVWVLTYLYFVFLSIASERIAMKTRVAYFKSLLYADIDWLENSHENSGKISGNQQNIMSMVEKRSTLELSQNMNQQCKTIQQALGEKIGQIYLSFAMSASGFAFAFLRGWLLSSIILCVFPILIVIIIVVNNHLKSGYSES